MATWGESVLPITEVVQVEVLWLLDKDATVGLEHWMIGGTRSPVIDHVSLYPVFKDKLQMNVSREQKRIVKWSHSPLYYLLPINTILWFASPQSQPMLVN